MRWTRFVLVLLVPLVLLGIQSHPTRANAPLNPIDDSFVRDKEEPYERDTNFDEHPDEILVTMEGVFKHVPVNVGYLRFDLTGVEGDVGAARLRLYNQIGPGPAIQVGVYATTSDDWNGAEAGLGDETTLTFNNAPAEDRLLDQQAGASDPAWMEFGGPALTDYVNSQIAGDGLVTFRVKMVSTGIVDISIFEDRENGGGTGNLPELVLEEPSSEPKLYLPLVLNEAFSN
jgi:hypothetical protein